MSRIDTRSILSFALLLAVIAGGPAQAQQPDTVYVDGAASGANDGTSWSDAYVHLQDALDEVNEGTTSHVIQVAEGVYYPDEDSDGDHTSDSEAESFDLGPQNSLYSVQLRGGYPSGGGERDPAEHVTVLSGDITQDDATNATGITENSAAINGGNSHHVLLIGTFARTETSVDGVTITGGQANGSEYDQGAGGGIRNEGSPKLIRVTFAGNLAERSGGGLFNVPAFGDPANPFIANATFVGNHAGSGGAIYNNGNGGAVSPTLINVAFTGNTSDNLGGGAVYNYASGDGASRPVYVNVSFAGNAATGTIPKGGAMMNFGADGAEVEPTLHNSIFWGNEAQTGGAQVHTNGSNTTIAVNHTLLEGGVSGIGTESGASVTDEGGNLSSNPQFVDADGADDSPGTVDDDLRLEGPGSGGGASPALDVGDGTVLPPDSTDLDQDGDTSENLPVDGFGNPRVQSATGTSAVDLGVYESDGSALPVELAGFDATAKGDQVRLSWTTASETGNARFEVQRTAEQQSGWTTVGSVDGVGTTTEAHTYRFTDGNLPYEANRLTYRLRQVDVDGSAHLSRTVDVRRDVTELELRGPFPNPASQEMTVRYTVPSRKKVTLRLHDVLGQQVQTLVRSPQNGRHQATLDVSDLPSGIYFLQLRVDGREQTQKVTVVR